MSRSARTLAYIRFFDLPYGISEGEFSETIIGCRRNLIDKMLQLTPEQQAIVAHDKGPALVFAVAGAGKTTAMVHRIERLVRERIFRPERILATSFSRATVDDVSKALKAWPGCSRVQAVTLHSLGWRVLNRAQSLGLIQLQIDKNSDPERLSESLINHALGIARDSGIVDKNEGRNIDREDFQTFVSACMGNLQYPDLLAADLPSEALQWATQAVAPSHLPWYLDLYRIFEQVRRERRAVTFDYMLLGAWEVLMRHPVLRSEWQAAFDCLIVDEFQDVNLVQSEILDILSFRHRNYMVIGDDDQTIYEWRGARPHFILRFAERYGAKRYFVSDNFRCKASQVVLANQIIAQNKQRERKSLHLTRGFDGRTFAHDAESIPMMGRQIVSEIKAARQKNTPLRDMAILVRLYAQTPHIEHPLIEEQIPYKIIGSTPFYDRPEVRVLLCYLRVARLNRLLIAGAPLSDAEFNDLGQMWRMIFNRPVRYISSELAEKIFQDVRYHHISLNQSIQKHAEEVHSWQRKHLEELADNLLWLATRLGPETDPNRQEQLSVLSQPTPYALHPPFEDQLLASSVLQELELRLEYNRFLSRSSGFPENAEGRVRNVEGLIEYADGKGTPIELLDHIARISFEKQQIQSDEGDFVSILTIFRAKGLEWPIVFIPDCNDGTIPFRGNQDNLEEERRLLYVAVTRTKRELHLYILRKNRTSPFLLEANYISTLENIEQIRHVLESSPHSWRIEHLLTIARHTQKLQLERYFSFWWQGHDEQKTALAREIQKIFRLAIQKKWLEKLDLDENNLAYWEEFGVFDEIPDATTIEEIQRLVGISSTASPRRNGSPDVSESPFVLGQIPTKEDYAIGLRVRHPSYGMGTILEVFEVNSNLRLVIDFGSLGKRRIAPGFVKMEILPSTPR